MDTPALPAAADPVAVAALSGPASLRADREADFLWPRDHDRRDHRPAAGAAPVVGSRRLRLRQVLAGARRRAGTIGARAGAFRPPLAHGQHAPRLSHIKVDLETEPKVLYALDGYLRHSQPVRAWEDSGDIPAGSRFAEEIAAGIQDSSLLCVLTDNYSTSDRPSGGRGRMKSGMRAGYPAYWRRWRSRAWSS